MMFILVVDIDNDVLVVCVANGKSPVPGLPGEFGRNDIVMIDPMRRFSFEQLRQLFNCGSS